jgi:hypothetical protein
MRKHTDVGARDFPHSPISDISLRLLNLPTPETGDFVEQILL